ncbi:MAG: TIGR03089 family protein [Mycobacteriales bacterium]
MRTLTEPAAREGLRDLVAAAHTVADDSSWAPTWRSFAEFATWRVAQRPAQPFLTYYDDDTGERTELSYATFANWVSKTANFLRDGLGVSRGERVATVLHNHWQTVVIYFACWSAGVSVVPLNVEEPAERKAFVLDNASTVAAFVREESLAEVLELSDDLPKLREVVGLSLRPLAAPLARAYPGVLDFATEVPAYGDTFAPDRECSLRDEALVVYTSGTTGNPKGVQLTGDNLLVDADAISAWYSLSADDRTMCVLPIHHVNGTIVTHVTPFYAGGGTVLNRKFKAETFFDRIATERVAIGSVVPTLLEFLMSADPDVMSLDLSRFRGLICGAGPLLVGTAARFTDRFGFPIHHGYGLSETTCYSCFLPTSLDAETRREWLTAHGFPSIGVAVRHNDMTVLRPDGSPAEAGERGELCIRGRNVMTGYLNRPDANTEAFRDGWFHSGDEGFWQPGRAPTVATTKSPASTGGAARDDATPYFFITGRLKELIIRGGVNLSPLEIDDVLRSAPGVAFAMAVPFANRWYGEEVAAYVVPQPGTKVDPDEVRAHCAERLDFKRQPKVVIVGDEVPYTSTGKPKRIELAQRLAGELAPYEDIQFRDPARA